MRSAYAGAIAPYGFSRWAVKSMVSAEQGKQQLAALKAHGQQTKLGEN